MRQLKNSGATFLLLTVSVLLAGCGAGVTVPGPSLLSSAAPGAEITLGTIQGSNYGGHAPLVGAHMYMLQPGLTGYGSLTKGLLTAAYVGTTYPTTKNVSDQFVPAADSAGNPYYYGTTDLNGAFNLTGNYTCTVGQPVYLVGYGGSPSYVGGGPNKFSISGADTAYSDGTHALFTYTVTGPATQLFYIGESVQVTLFTGGSAGFNISGTVADPGSASQTVTVGATVYKPTLTTSQFSIYVTTALPAGTYTPLAGTFTNAIVTGTPSFNPAAVNVTMLGICPSTGNFYQGASALSYVYMNEVSTTAFGYAMNQFANWSATALTGNDEFHIGAPNTTQAQTGLQNAAINAGNLYDIQGIDSGISTTFNGEGHLARSVTHSGAGIVPQSQLDTMANILAACVDSQNTFLIGVGGTQSTQCLKLGQLAQDNGVYDTTSTTHQAANIAQAALNIGHYPAGAGTGTTSGSVQTVTAGTATSAANFATGLFNLPTGNVPYAPNLNAAPNDWSVGINWQTSPYALSGTQTGSTTNQASVGEVAIDTLGNAFINSNMLSGNNGIYRLTPTGVYTFFGSAPFTAVATVSSSGLAIDTSNNLFVSSTAGVQEHLAVNYNTTGLIGYVQPFGFYNTNVTANSGQLAIDSATTPSLYVADLYQPNPASAPSGNTSSRLVKELGTIGNVTATFSNTAGGAAVTANTANACSSYLGYLTVDTAGSIWTSNQAYGTANPSQVCRFNNSGTLQYSSTAATSSHMIAVDASGNAWWPDTYSNTLIKAASGVTSATGVNGVATTYTFPSAILKGPTGIAVDGANTLWVTNATNGAIARVSTSGTQISPTFYTGGGFNVVTGGGTPSATFATVDQAGNLWSSDTGHGEIIEWIGVASPTTQPLLQQRVNTTAGNGHGIGQLP